MVSDALADHVGKEIVAMNFLTDVFRQCLQQRIILYTVIPNRVRKSPSSINGLIPAIEVNDSLLPFILRQVFVHFFKLQQDIRKVSIPATSVTYIRNMNSIPVMLVINLNLVILQVYEELHLYDRRVCNRQLAIITRFYIRHHSKINLRIRDVW